MLSKVTPLMVTGRAAFHLLSLVNAGVGGGVLQQLKTKTQMKDTRKKALRMSSRQSCRNWVMSVL